MKKQHTSATKITKNFWILKGKPVPECLKKFSPFQTAAIIFPSGDNHVFDICQN